MKVLVACEESQTVTKAFRKAGHESYSCDILECSGGHPDWHYNQDVKEVLWGIEWDMVIAHPPCTRLANSGVRWLEKRDLWEELKKGISFFNEFQRWALRTNKPTAIENPIPHKYAVYGIGKYDQIIQPWQYGHGETKATCLWLYNLPKLKPTNIVEGRDQRIHKLPPSPYRSKLRSQTYQGIA